MLRATQFHELPDLARRLLRERGERRRVLALRLPGARCRALAGGGLLPAQPGPRGRQTFADWLAGISRQPAGADRP